MNVWDESPVCEVDDLRQKATAAGEKIHIAEVMEIGSIKLDELGPSLSQHKGRLVFRGMPLRTRTGCQRSFGSWYSNCLFVSVLAFATHSWRFL